MSRSQSRTPKSDGKPRFTASRTKKNDNGVWTAQIDERGAHWYGCVQIHRGSLKEAKRMRDLFLKAMNK